MNWYTETELRHGMSEWDILCELFLLTFTFKDHWWDTVDDVLQAVKVVIFKIPQEAMEELQSEWVTQLSCALERYNVNIEENDEDPQSINIPEIEGCHEVRGPSIEDPDITVLLKTKQVNIWMAVEPKYAMLDDYWDDAMVDKVAELLHEQQDLLQTKIMDLKGIVGNLGMMNITLKPYEKLVKQRPYCLNPMYKQKVYVELDKMLAARIIELVEESHQVSPMLVQEKKQKGE